MTQGIYAITHKPSGWVYLGAAMSIERRFEEHRKALHKKSHHNAALQEVFSSSREDDFDFSIVEEVSGFENISSAEQNWIQNHEHHCFNSKSASPYPSVMAERGSFSEMAASIRAEIAKTGQSQAEIARQIGMEPQELSRALQRQGKIPPVWVKILDHFNLDLTVKRKEPNE